MMIHFIQYPSFLPIPAMFMYILFELFQFIGFLVVCWIILRLVSVPLRYFWFSFKRLMDQEQ